MTVGFTQTSPGTHFDSLQILSNDEDHSSIRVRLTAIPQPADLTVTVTEGDPSGLYFKLGKVVVTVTDPLGPVSTLTDDLNSAYWGQAFFYGLTPGNFTVTCQLQGYAKKSVSGVLQSGQNSIVVPMAILQPLWVSITSPQDGAVVNSPSITVSGSVNNNAQVTVNGVQAIVVNGAYSASIPLSEGANTITVRATDPDDQTAAKSINVTCIISGNIAGTVTSSSNGQPLSSATVSVTDSANGIHTAVTIGNGTFSIASLAAGSFSGTVTKDGYSAYTFSGVVTLGGTVTVNAAMAPLFPVISAVTINSTTVSSASITWTTDQSTSSIIAYGETTAYGALATDATLTTNHSISITGLSAGKTYHLKITATNSYGFSSSSNDFTFTTPLFSATTIGDYGNITVMEVVGNYDAKKADGSINAYPRQEIAKEFIRTHQDQYDFLVILSNFDFAMPQTEAKAFYMEVKNDTQGIGKTIFSNSGSFGSNGKLYGIIDMGNIANLGIHPLDSTKFETTLDTLAHEQLHRWGASVKFKNPDGSLSTALLGQDGAHWSYLLDTDGSLEYGNDWQANADGTFTSVSAPKYYSNLDLYLMGMIDKSQVPAMTLIENASIDPTKLPELGATITGTAKTVTIDDIIAAEGERVPNTSTSQKTFKTGFIFITQPGTFTGSEPPAIETVRNAWAGRFASLTGGRGSVVDVTPSLSIAITSPSNGATISRPDVTVKGIVANSTGNETGVTVNGVPAIVYGSQFTAAHVPLSEGANTITITATDTAGTTTTSMITVNATTTGNYIRVTSNIESGVVPLEATLRVDGSFSIASSSISATGPAAPEITTIAPDEYKVKMVAEGTYTFTVSAMGPDGNTYQDAVTITVMNRVQLDKLLKAKWEGMKNALKDGNTMSALNYIASSSRQKYNEAFATLQTNIAQIAAGMQSIELVYVAEAVAKSRIRRDQIINGQMETIAYYIYFSKNPSGIWQIEQF